MKMMHICISVWSGYKWQQEWKTH